jgi:hypothetical protein
VAEEGGATGEGGGRVVTALGVVLLLFLTHVEKPWRYTGAAVVLGLRKGAC